MLALLPMQGLSRDSVRDTIAAVFHERAYDRTIVRTLLDRMWQAVIDWVNSILSAVSHSGAFRLGFYLLVIAIVVALAVRLTIVGFASDIAYRRGGGARGRGGSDDPWGDADRFAKAGQYTDAAHSLYRGLLDSMARREQIQLHHSKTVGDYGRDLRRRASNLAPRYRDFARSYETVVYGLRPCDRERYERLHALATDMVRPAA